jgi:DNA-binding transcriptional MerR regulator
MDYSIRELADRFGITLRALRFYEGKGLLTPVRKTGSTRARRTYSENDAFRIAEILRGARFGLKLREIRQHLVDGPTGPYLDIPPEIAAEKAKALYDEICGKQAALEELGKIAGKAVGAISGKTGTTPPPGVAKRASASVR